LFTFKNLPGKTAKTFKQRNKLIKFYAKLGPLLQWHGEATFFLTVYEMGNYAGLYMLDFCGQLQLTNVFSAITVF